ncbi:ShTK domain-containing protein [Ditylenchus destructor]|uniref:ShTK domain-containing protein n=1 Tax=Ditylenchus destructor TaxID=166010 RepID=A0AAD4MTV0_9BILA|nr:ShTK domain-containing protein [Ditylenchus destructor]
MLSALLSIHIFFFVLFSFSSANPRLPPLTPLVDVEDRTGMDVFTVLPEHCFNNMKYDANGNVDKSPAALQSVTLKQTPKSCVDTIPKTECENLFQNDLAGAPTPKKVSIGTVTPEHFIDDLCLSPNFADEAIWCAATCKLCCMRPEYNCADRPGSVSNLCEKFQTDPTKCDKDPDWENCRQTCGKCNESTCADQHIACEYLRGLCLEPDHSARVQRLCPKTCDIELKKQGHEATACKRYIELFKFRTEPVKPEPGCGDKSHNCQTNVMLCEDEVFMSKMATGCRHTCGHCVKEDFVCEDKDSAKCEKWHQNGFCEVDGDYPKGVMVEYCPKKCNLCK